jgi:hypothetical protein
MKAHTYLGSICLTAWLGVPALLLAQGANSAEVLRRGDLVTYTGQPEVAVASAGARPVADTRTGADPRTIFDSQQADLAADTPASDAGKWFVTVYTGQGCSVCEKLLADWRQSEALLMLGNPSDQRRSATHFNVYSNTRASQRFRFAQAEPPITAWPTIMVQPPRDGSYGSPRTTVFRQTGYDGDASGLAQKMSAAIRQYSGRVRPTVPDAVTPPLQPSPTPLIQPSPAPLVNIPQPAPVNPSPFLPLPAPLQPFAPPTVTVQPTIPPVMPSPVVAPAPPAPAPVAPQPNKYPDYPQAVLILDPQGFGEELLQQAGEAAITKLQGTLGHKIKALVLNWDEAQGKFPVDRSQLPCVALTNAGKLEALVSADVLHVFDQPADVKTITVPGPTIEKEVPGPTQTIHAESIADLPWASLLGLLSTGGIGAAALPTLIALWGWYRDRLKQQGKMPVIPDWAYDAITGPEAASAVQKLLPKAVAQHQGLAATLLGVAETLVPKFGVKSASPAVPAGAASPLSDAGTGSTSGA